MLLQGIWVQAVVAKILFWDILAYYSNVEVALVTMLLHKISVHSAVAKILLWYILLYLSYVEVA